MNEETQGLLALVLTDGLGVRRIGRILSGAGSAAAGALADGPALAAWLGGPPARAEALAPKLRAVREEGLLERELTAVERHGVRLVRADEPDYPPRLKAISDPPPLLYVRGRLEAVHGPAVAMVGSRRCSRYGREQAERFAGLCAQAGLCVVSGGALGIDGAAHQAALRVNGITAAVLGSGLARPYPGEHAELFAAMVEKDGLLLSEFPMTVPSRRENFPRRNRVIAGLALGTLVVEAAPRSGALITARAALDQGRPLMAVPGPADSRTSIGCHDLIRAGQATLVTRVEHVFEALGTPGPSGAGSFPAGLEPAMSANLNPTLDLFAQTLTEPQARIIAALDQPRSLDDLCETTSLSAAALSAELTMLQIRGLIDRANGRIARKG